MTVPITDEEIRDLSQSARPYSLALLRWGPQRQMDGATTTELEHQRRMVSLRANGTIVVLCPIESVSLAGMAILDLPPAAAREVMAGDPCVRADMMRCDVYPCHGFPGDGLPLGDSCGG